jgi:hypothetical protein
MKKIPRSNIHSAAERRLLFFTQGAAPESPNNPAAVPVTNELSRLLNQLEHNTLTQELALHVRNELRARTARGQQEARDGVNESMQNIATAYFIDLRERGEYPVPALQRVNQGLGMQFVQEDARLRIATAIEAPTSAPSNSERSPERLRGYVQRLQESTSYFISVVRSISPESAQQDVRQSRIGRWMLHERFQAFPNDNPPQVKCEVVGDGARMHEDWRSPGTYTVGQDVVGADIDRNTVWLRLEQLMNPYGKSYAQLVQSCIDAHHSWGEQFRTTVTQDSPTVQGFNREQGPNENISELGSTRAAWNERSTDSPEEVQAQSAGEDNRVRRSRRARPTAPTAGIVQSGVRSRGQESGSTGPEEDSTTLPEQPRTWEIHTRLQNLLRSFYQELPEGMRQTAIGQFFNRASIRTRDGVEFAITTDAAHEALFKHMYFTMIPDFRRQHPAQVIRRDGQIEHWAIAHFSSRGVEIWLRGVQERILGTGARSSAPASAVLESAVTGVERPLVAFENTSQPETPARFVAVPPPAENDPLRNPRFTIPRDPSEPRRRSE